MFDWVYRPIWQLFIHMETSSSLPMKGRKFWPMLGASFYNGYIRRFVILTPIAEGFAVELLLPGLLLLGFEHLTFCLRGERSYQLRHHRGKLFPNESNIYIISYETLMLLMNTIPRLSNIDLLTFYFLSK